jgi:HD-like signal output (HDOD) protein/signal transduction histidine kinase
MNRSDQDIRNRLLVARLPAMPQILLKLLELCQADGSGMSEIAKLIANDPGITHRILSVANSAAYNKGGQRASLMQALSTLGADMIKTLVINESVLNTFSAFPNSNNTDLRMFWKHCLTTAVIARDLAKAMDYPLMEEAYLAGLLHDVGRLALLAVVPHEYDGRFYLEDDENLCGLEFRALSLTHAEAGAWLVERWKLDSFMADAVLYHHEPVERIEGAHALIRIVHLADRLANQDALIPLAPGAGDLCKLPNEILQPIRQSAESQVVRAAAFLGLDLSDLETWTPPDTASIAMPVVPVAQQRLNDEIRHMTMAAEVGHAYALQKDDTQLLKVIRQSAHILFDLEDTIILLMSGSGQSLIGVSVGEQRQRLAEFSIPLLKGGGVAETALQGRVAFLQRRGAPLGLAEDQLCRIFDVENLVSVPLTVGGKCLGVLVAGVPALLLGELRSRERFLQAFGVQAAAALNDASRERGEIDRRIASVREEHIASSRRVLHEVNNPLAIIKNYLGVLDDKLTRQEPVGDAISILNEEIDRVGNILNEFAGTASSAPPSKVEINRIASNLIRLFRESKFLPPTVEIVTRLSDQDCVIEGSADTLKQILVNLIKNSVEAMSQGGRIEIINGGRFKRGDTSYFLLSVKDNGPGIPLELRSRIFSPVKSSKTGVNRGIGLSIVHGLVKKLGGEIECASVVGATEFKIYLPAVDVQKSDSPIPKFQDLV